MTGVPSKRIPGTPLPHEHGCAGQEQPVEYAGCKERRHSPSAALNED